MMPPGKRRFYTELESLRGVAALMVVLFHVFAGKQPNADTLSHFSFSEAMTLILTSMFSGTGAVTLFFVLSGFVLGESLGRMKILSARSYLEFMVKRVFRLLPAAWASIALAIAVFAVRGIPIPWEFFGPTLMLKEQALPAFNPPLWSLHVEMWSSAVFPMLVFANRFISAPFQVVIVAVLLWLPYSGACPYWAIYFFCFQFGLMIRSVFIPAIQDMSDRFAFATFVMGVIAVLVPTNLHLMGFLNTFDHAHIEGIGASIVVSYLLVPQGEWLAAALNGKPLRFLGRISYSLYVFHFPLTALVVTWTWNNIIAQPYLVAQFVCIFTVVPVCLAAGTLGYYLIEAPFLRLGRHAAELLQPRSTASA